MKKWLVLVMAIAVHTSVFAEGDAAAGQVLFDKTCGGCHKIGANARSGFGPQLNGVFGRHAGSTTDYVYSKAMLGSGIVWDTANLTAFIKDPSDVVAGTKMSFWGMSDQQKIDELLAYLHANP